MKITITIKAFFFTKSPPSVNYSINLQTNQCEALYLINFEKIAYHQNEALYIIIAKPYIIHALRDDIQPIG